jgi:hypothetical protein
MSEQTKTEPQGIAQKQRWVKYGLNVGVLIFAALVIVVLLNWIAARNSTRWGRIDATKMQQYSLSPQTLSVLGKLDRPVNITMLYAAQSADAQYFGKIQDLLNEYRRRSDRVHVEQIDPAADHDRFEQFAEGLIKGYSGVREKIKAELAEANKTLEQVRQFTKTQSKPLAAVDAALAGQDKQASAVLRQLATIFENVEDQLHLTQAQKDMEESFKNKLPDYAAAREAAVRPLRSLEQGILGPAIRQLNEIAEHDSAPAAAKESALALKPEYEKLAETIKAQLDRIGQIDSSAYDDLVSSIRSRNTVVVSIDNPAPAPSVAESIKDPKAKKPARRDMSDQGVPKLILSQISRDVEPDDGYKGEEVVTGALLRLTFKHNTRVVFVNPFPFAVLGRPNGNLNFNEVAEQLRKMNFDVSEWQPGGSTGPNGQPAPPQPRPVAEPGQKLIFIALPTPPPNPQMPFNPAGMAAANAVKEHVEAGRPVMLIPMPSSPLTPPGQGDAMLDLLKPFGLVVENTRLVVSSVPGRNGRPQTTTENLLNQWPATHPIGRALSGLQGYAVQAMPIDIPAKPPEGVQLSPLATTAADSWGETDFQNLAQAKHDDSDPSGPFTIAAAAQKGDQRLVLITDVLWASDRITRLGPTDIEGRMLFSTFPANAQLFVNSVYWLAGLDDLIAPGARTRDVRRIGAISPAAALSMRWVVLLGFPLATLTAGAAVWLIRRK